MSRVLKFVLIPVVGIYLLLCVGLYLHQTKFIFIPQREVENTPRDFGCAFEDVQFAAVDGKQLRGWWLAANDSNADSAAEQRAALKADPGSADEASYEASEEKREDRDQTSEQKQEERAESATDNSNGNPEHRAERKPVQKPRRLAAIKNMVTPEAVAAVAGNRGLNIHTIASI